jgi:hypothetical protein
MSMLLKLIIGCCLSFTLYAQEQQFRLRGSFPFDNNQLPLPSVVNFDLEWNQMEDGIIRGDYQDNYFQLSSTSFSGTTGEQGRTMNVQLPATVNGVRTLTYQTHQTGLQDGQIMTRVILRDDIGNIISSKDVTATIVASTPLEAPDTNTACTTGFGILSNYCGLYAGRFTEVEDSQNRCDLLQPAGEIRLELGLESSMNLYINYVDTTINSPMHALGRLPSSPLDPTVTLTARNCGALPGTRMEAQNCQTLTLTATFTEFSDQRTVSGNYTIVDEVTGARCRYDLAMERVLSY